MGSGTAMTGRMNWLPNVRGVRTPSCSSVSGMVRMFVSLQAESVMVALIATEIQMSY